MEINPYASPLGIGGHGTRPEPVIGVWRDGPFLVMHRDAELPRLCIHTGEPAVGGREYVLVWKQPGALFTSSKTILIPLCQPCARDFLSLRRRSFLGLGFAAAGLLLLLAAPLLQEWGLLAVGGTLLCGAFGVFLWVEALWTKGRPLSVAHALGDYLWLRDVHRDFLAKLPEWKGGV